MMSIVVLWVLLLGFAVATTTSGSISINTNSYHVAQGGRLLNQVPFIFSHDAGTGYLEKDNVVTHWAKTQTVGFAGQLDCGSRGFDLRPKVVGGELMMHHGDVDVHKLVKEAMAEVVEWAGRNQSELVIPYVTDCAGDGCQEMTKAVFRNLSIPYIDDCRRLVNLTEAGARAMAKLPTGGLVLAIFGCVDEQYDPSVECYTTKTFNPSGENRMYVCYDPETRLVPLTHFWNVLVDNTKQQLYPDGSKLWMAQAHWQYGVESTAEGILHNSSVLEDERRSQTNIMLVQNITQRAFNFVNIIELNYVCDQGNAILQALRTVFP